MWRRVFPQMYDWVMTAVERGPLGRWRRSVVEPARGLVIEIAAGTGLDFPHYAPSALVVATDPDAAMLCRARRRADAAVAVVLLVAADAEALPFRDATFDAAVVGLALCTIPHPPLALGELRRAVRLGGAVRLLEHVRVNHPVVGRLQHCLTPLWRRVAGGCRLDRDTVSAVRASGLVVEAVTAHAGEMVVEIAARVRLPSADS